MKKYVILLTSFVMSLNTYAQASNAKDTLHFKIIEKKAYIAKDVNRTLSKGKEIDDEFVLLDTITASFLYDDLKSETIFFDKNQNKTKIIHLLDSTHNSYDDSNFIKLQKYFYSVNKDGNEIPKTFITEYHRYSDNKIHYEWSYLENEKLPINVKLYHYNYNRLRISAIEKVKLLDTTIFTKYVEFNSDAVRLCQFIPKNDNVYKQKIDVNNYLFWIEDYYYDDNNNLRSKDLYFNSKRKLTYYNDAGQKTKAEYRIDNDEFYEIFDYDKKQHLVNYSSYATKDPNTANVKYKYTLDDLSSIKITYNNKSAVIGYTYKFDDRGNWTEKVIAIDGVPKYIVYRTISYYDK